MYNFRSLHGIFEKIFEILHRRNAIAATIIYMQMNLRKCLLLVFVIINILMQAVIADPQEIEHSQNSTSSTQISESKFFFCYT